MEFIVWDKLSKLFFMKDEVLIQSGKIVSLYDGGEWFSVEGNSVEIFQYIGKTDINNKKIYADCSIVEFNCSIWGNSVFKSKGYFTFNDISLRYVIVSLCGKRIAYDIDYIKNIEIIDTIQENKLNLIGE